VEDNGDDAGRGTGMVSDPSRLVGERLRSARAQRSLTARDLAAASDLSFNTISLIERGKMSPTISTLHKLATALGVPLAYFVEEETTSQVLFLKRGQRQQARSGRVLLENLGSGLEGQTLEALLLTLEPGADSGPDPILHAGHELVFCLEGCIEYQVEGAKYRLEPQDSLLFEAYLPHRWRNALETATKVLLIIQAAQGSEASRRAHA
jgi:transcriptional regulator with XRE-family HTH domain